MNMVLASETPLQCAAAVRANPAFSTQLGTQYKKICKAPLFNRLQHPSLREVERGASSRQAHSL